MEDCPIKLASCFIFILFIIMVFFFTHTSGSAPRGFNGLLMWGGGGYSLPPSTFNCTFLNGKISIPLYERQWRSLGVIQNIGYYSWDGVGTLPQK